MTSDDQMLCPITAASSFGAIKSDLSSRLRASIINAADDRKTPLLSLRKQLLAVLELQEHP
jgi:hypothetical protein